ncbi:MAG: helix-turn-helix transcriptional regulator [Bacteroidales bacterium]|nr:helix-turn-helix transcriptional regulator [Bacteroidales bacterium]
MENPKMVNTIRVERAKKRITQAELAEKLKVSRQTIHSIETGKFVPSVVLALKIAQYFDVEFKEIFQLTENEIK